MSKLLTDSTYKWTFSGRDDIFALFCVSRAWGVTSDFQEKVNLGSTEACCLALQLRARRQMPAAPIFHLCWSDYSEYNSGPTVTLEWGVGRGWGRQASEIFKSPWVILVFSCGWKPLSYLLLGNSTGQSQQQALIDRGRETSERRGRL